MAFNPQQIYPIDLNANKAVGVDIPFSGNAVFISNYLTKDAIKNNLINFFLTNPGERYLNPTFGGGLRAFIFEQISQDNIIGLKDNLNYLIKQYFPSIIINDLQILQQENSNSIIVELTYSIPNTNITDNITIQF